MNMQTIIVIIAMTKHQHQQILYCSPFCFPPFNFRIHDRRRVIYSVFIYLLRDISRSKQGMNDKDIKKLPH